MSNKYEEILQYLHLIRVVDENRSVYIHLSSGDIFYLPDDLAQISIEKVLVQGFSDEYPALEFVFSTGHKLLFSEDEISFFRSDKNTPVTLSYLHYKIKLLSSDLILDVFDESFLFAQLEYCEFLINEAENANIDVSDLRELLLKTKHEFKNILEEKISKVAS